MSNIIIPDSLSTHSSPYYYSNQYFTKENMRSVCCYFHASNRGWVFPLNMHSHEFYEINIVVGGEGVHYINNEKINIEIGDVFILPPNLEHGYFEIANLEIFHILLGSEFFSTYKTSLKAMEGYVSLFSVEPSLRGTQLKNAFLHLSKGPFNDVLDDINRLMQYSEENIYHYNIQAAFVFQIICKFCIQYRATALPEKHLQAKNSYAPMIVFAMEFMKKNLSQKITIDTIAKELSISPATFQRYFTDLMHISPMEYLTKLRIKQSKKLLRTTDKAIVFIAYECGFYDSPHFFRQFKKYEGISPSQYRKSSTSKTVQ